jgi:uncharacterized protein
MRNSWLAVASMGLAWGGAARAVSFDCAKAATPQEKAICSSPELGAADDGLAVAYRAILAAAPSDMAAELRFSQVRWVRTRDAQCKVSGASQMAECLMDQYQSRTETLQNMIVSVNGLTFVTRSITLKGAATVGAPHSEERKTEIEQGFGEVNAKWPQSRGDTPEWRAWNQEVETAVRMLASGGCARDERGNCEPVGPWSNAWVDNMVVDIVATVGFSGLRLVTVSIDDDWDGFGAAHPNYTTMQLNWMLNEKRELKPGVVFRAGSGWEKFIEARCLVALRTQLGEELGADWDFAGPLHSVVLSPENWMLTDSTLTIVFPEYSVSTHADPADPVSISWDELKPFMAEGFPVPR